MDLSKLIEDLTERGWTQVRLAKEIGCAQSTISAIANRANDKRGPSFQVASSLVDLHRIEMAKPPPRMVAAGEER